METGLVEISETTVQIIRTRKEVTVVMPTLQNKGLFLKLTKSYNPSGMTPQQLYEATRKEWKINMKRTAQIEYVFALYKNLIVEVYKPTEWYVNLRTGRLMFEGELAPIEVRQACINQYLSAVEGVRGPVIYNF